MSEEQQKYEVTKIEQCLVAGPLGVNISNEVYHALPGISSSNLSLLAESNRHLDNKHLFSVKSSSLDFGTLLHTMVLEPDEIEKRYVVMPKFDGRTNAGKAEKASFHADNGHKIVIEKDDFERADKMARNILAICGHIIEHGTKERSLFIAADGLILKTRIDIDHQEEGDEYDLKSITLGTKDFSNATLEAHIKKYKYHWSAAFRNIVRNALELPVRDNYLIFCNTGPGHMVRMIRLNKDWIAQAELEIKELLDSRRFYLASNVDIPVAEIDDRYRLLNT